MLKKIFIMMSLIVSAFALTINSSYAVLVEKSVTFDVISIHEVGEELRKVVTVEENMYEKLSAYTGWDQSFNNQNNPYPLTIKKGSLSYEGRLSHRYHLTWNTYIYTLGIKFDEAWSSIAFYPNDFTIASTNPIHITIGQGLFSTSNRGMNFNNVIGSYSLHGLFESEIIDENGTNVDDVSEIPLTSGTLANAFDISKVGYVYFEYDANDLFDTYIVLNGNQYNLGQLKLPGVKELNREPISPGIYYSENGKQYLYYEFVDSTSQVPINDQALSFIDDIDNVKGFRPFVSMNLTDGTYVFTDKLKLYAAYHDGGNGKAFADVLFPMQLDDLLAIEMEYSYRYQYYWGLNYSPWATRKIARVKDEVVDMVNTWQHVTNWMLSPALGIYDAISTLSGWTSGETITPVTDLNNTYKNKYLETINLAQSRRNHDALTMDQVFTPNVSMYRVYLDTLAEFGSTGYQVHDDIIILSATYKYEGDIYHVGYEDIDVVTGGGSSDVVTELERLLQMFTDFQTFIASVDWNNAFTIIIAVVVGIVGLMLLNPLILIIKLIFGGIRLAFLGVINLIKIIFKIPGQLFNLLKLLFIPKKKNKYKRSYRK